MANKHEVKLEVTMRMVGMRNGKAAAERAKFIAEASGFADNRVLEVHTIAELARDKGDHRPE